MVRDADEKEGDVMASNYEEIMKKAGEAEALLDDVDARFRNMVSAGATASLNAVPIIRNLKKTKKIFDKLDKLSKMGGDSYTVPEAQAITARARELTRRYDMYLELLDQAYAMTKEVLKSSAAATADAAGELVRAPAKKFREIFKGKKKEDQENKGV